MMTIPQVKVAMLLAAGLGTRLQPFTHNRCKAVLPVMGLPVAQFAIQSLAQAGVEKIVANVHHDAKRTEATLRSLLPRTSEPQTRLEISDESELLLGSGGAWRKALPLLGEGPFFLANADVICDVDWNALAQAHFRLRKKWGVSLTISLFKKAALGGKYREFSFNSDSGLIESLGDLAEGKPFFSGAAVLELEALRNVPEGVADFVSLVLRPEVQKGKVGFHFSDQLWLDVGSPSTWLGSHLVLMRELETRGLNGPNGPIWRKSIQAKSRRLAPSVWVSSRRIRPIRSVDWQGPCFWEDSSGTSRAPRHLGPNAVLYGQISQENLHALNGKECFEGGIGHDGIWVPANPRL